MAAHQASPSLGFSRQEHWSGLPFPSPYHFLGHFIFRLLLFFYDCIRVIKLFLFLPLKDILIQSTSFNEVLSSFELDGELSIRMLLYLKKMYMPDSGKEAIEEI